MQVTSHERKLQKSTTKKAIVQTLIDQFSKKYILFLLLYVNHDLVQLILSFIYKKQMENIPFFTQQEVFEYQSIPTTQEFKQVLLHRSKSSQTLAELILKLYSFATDSQWDITMKCGLLNLALKVLGDLVKSHSKQDFVQKLKRQCELTGRRDGNYKRLFNQLQIEQLKNLLRDALLPYYELYRIVFDRHFHFRLETNKKQFVQEVQESDLAAGASVQVEGIAILQQFVGIRQPKQQKKDAKKK